MLNRDRSPLAGRVPVATPDVDERERFVLRGGVEDLAEAATTEPEEQLDIEDALRQLADPERSRTRARRHSSL
jgi:hypothetical protein